MSYRATFTVPANTLATAPTIEEVSLKRGILTEVDILFPAGAAGMVNFQIWHWEHQLYPYTPGESFVGHNTRIVLRDDYPILEARPVLYLVGWSPGTSYDHTIYVTFRISDRGSFHDANIEWVEVPV